MLRNPRGRPRVQSKFEINEKIRSKEVRVIGEDNEMLGILSLTDALLLKDEKGLDLVSISSGANPPVCKLIDYGKFLYQQEKKRKEGKKNQKNVQLKEIKMRPKTDVHDYDFKIKHAKEFLAKGNKVKITIKFKGREMSFISLGKDRIERIIKDTEDIARVEVNPKLEGRNLQMVLGPKVGLKVVVKANQKNVSKKESGKDQLKQETTSRS